MTTSYPASFRTRSRRCPTCQFMRFSLVPFTMLVAELKVLGWPGSTQIRVRALSSCAGGGGGALNSAAPGKS